MGQPTAAYHKDLMREFIGDVMGGMPQCFYCVHQNPDKPNTCKAYPDAIPLEIVANEVDHHEAYEGDGGVVYQAKPGAESTTPDEEK